MSGCWASSSASQITGEEDRCERSVAGVQVIIKASCECCADSGDFLEVCGPGAQHALHAAEMLEQGPALGWAETRHCLEHRLVVAAGALAAVAGDGKAMRLVPDALNEPRCG